MASAKRPLPAPPSLVLHLGMPKADLDLFLKNCGASQPNVTAVRAATKRPLQTLQKLKNAQQSDASGKVGSITLL